VTACVSRWRRLDPQTVPIEAKVAANYMNGIVARTERVIMEPGTYPKAWKLAERDASEAAKRAAKR